MNQNPDTKADGPEYSDRCISRLDGWIYAREYEGEGPAFVLMHGLPDNLRIYDGLIPHLVAAGRRVVTFDFLGFGESAKPADASYGFEQQRGDLLAVIDALELDRIIPVAHDSSGSAAVNFAIDHTERTHSVCILNSIYAMNPAFRLPELIDIFATPKYRALTQALLASPQQFGWMFNFQRDMFQVPIAEEKRSFYTSVLGPIIDHNFSQQPSAARAFAFMTADLYEEAARNVDRLPLIEKLDVPFRFIWGEADPYLKSDLAEDLRAHLKHSTMRLIPAGHWVQIEEAQAVAEAMLA